MPIPNVHGARNQDERFLDRTRPVLRLSRRMRRRVSPRVLLPVDQRQSGIANVVAAVGVDDGRVWRSGDVEGFAADDRFVLEGDGPRDEGEFGLGDTGAR